MSDTVKFRARLHKSTWVELEQYLDIHRGTRYRVLDRAVKAWLKKRRPAGVKPDEKLKPLDVNQIKAMEEYESNVQSRILLSPPLPDPVPAQPMEIITARGRRRKSST